MATIELRTNLGSLDLEDGAEREFYITRQIHDLNNLETRNADYSKTIKVPPTPNNIDILDAYAGVEDSERTIPCQIIIDGITVAPNARLLFSKKTIANKDVSYDVTILYGNFNLFDDILEGNINDMAWSDLTYEHTHENYVLHSENTTDLCTPIVDWMDRASSNIYPLTPNVEINTGGFFLYAKEIIKRIINEAGYNVDYATNLPARFFEIALSCPINQFFELGDSDQISISSKVQNTLAQNESNGTARAIFQTDLTPSIALWNGTLNQFEIVNANEMTVELQGVFSHSETGTRPDSFIRIVHNGATIDELITNSDEDDVPFYLSASITVVPGDLIYAEIQSQATQTTITLHRDAILSIATVGVTASRTVIPEAWIPAIGKNEFITNILKLFNIVITTDDITKVVTFRPWDDVLTGEEQNLTSVLDVGQNKIEKDYSIGSLGQNSIFEWTNDNLRRTDTDYQLRLNNQLLAKEVTSISMIFSACDNSLLINHFASEPIPRAKVPNCSKETEAIQGTNITIQADGSYVIDNADVSLQVGMWIEGYYSGNTHRYRVIQVDGDSSGVVQTPIIVSIQNVSIELRAKVKGNPNNPAPRLAIIQLYGAPDVIDAVDGSYYGGSGNITRFTASSLSAMWLDELKMVNIVPTYYGNFINAQKTPEIVKAWFNITTLLFNELDFLRPVYIEEFNAFYYINRIEQFKPEQKTRLELVRISVLTE